jgi:serine protease Do/serine protease DegQ
VAATIGIAERGTRLEVVYLREGREGRTTLTVETPSESMAIAGADVIMARGASMRAASDGLQVFAVEGGSAAAAAGLQAGDLISQVDGGGIAGLDSLAMSLGAEGARVLSVIRAGEPVEITLP